MSDFKALGSADGFAGLETFPNPGVAEVELVSDEFTAVCPVTGHPDLYVLTVRYWPDDLCVESKSIKLYLGSFRNEGAFCEALVVRLRDDFRAALDCEVEALLVQKSRGGIVIKARAGRA